MRDLINILEAIEQGCPPATQSIDLNLKNRQKAIDEYGYGPLDPNAPNEEFWSKKAKEWNMSNPDDAKSARCGNCAAFDESKEMQACIAKGIGSEPGSDPMSTIDAGTLGYCKFLKFKCAAKRTCDAWVEGGPITEEQLDEKTADHIRMVMNLAADLMKKHGYRAVTQLGHEDLEQIAKQTDATLHDVCIILNIDHVDQQLDELQFMGSTCTKDCSGHRAGYAWSKARGGQNANNPFSPSFNKGSAIATQEIAKSKQQPKKPAPQQAQPAPNPLRPVPEPKL